MLLILNLIEALDETWPYFLFINLFNHAAFLFLQTGIIIFRSVEMSRVFCIGFWFRTFKGPTFQSQLLIQIAFLQSVFAYSNEPISFFYFSFLNNLLAKFWASILFLIHLCQRVFTNGPQRCRISDDVGAQTD